MSSQRWLKPLGCNPTAAVWDATGQIKSAHLKTRRKENILSERKQPGWRGKPSPLIMQRIYRGEEKDLEGYDLTGAELSGANLRACFLVGANLRGANLSDANLEASA